MGEKITGAHAIEEALKQASAGSTLYIQRGMGEKGARLERLAQLTGRVAVKKLSAAELDRMVPGIDHRGAVMDLGSVRRGGGRANTTTVEDFLGSLEEGKDSLVMVLDGITDPHNLGAILRSADQFGVDLVVVPERRSAQANETVARVSSGASQYVPTAVVTNITSTLTMMKDHGFWIYGADMNGESSETIEFTGRCIIVMGSEGDGMSRLVRENCDFIVSIPMQGHIDSLNVSVAAGILMYEARRQRRALPGEKGSRT
ncbi:23S rRNA (guanosine(2251)-2'-O)-methyltransferase RlmB [Parasphaerochaeta coccoides]|uniref:RNA methyltransferase, TrmH family, group 3 n=1 Tax=Parasphaerochaeta coccoides (strain ATCC BAA-1237 / DSM 17374 / SPN1) TaxID=760011 RepID=F4GKJ1_PARC1|nr:23S rRNA (guanosine(2251)-2'-O)-methyltransferase RlmB [Parasphaerochaeta coccoides]AEC02874.1 RNA methyltransferase, TrmH family, group 3 [Parasphaerochaeta coccoides DSM 17374]